MDSCTCASSLRLCTNDPQPVMASADLLCMMCSAFSTDESLMYLASLGQVQTCTWICVMAVASTRLAAANTLSIWLLDTFQTCMQAKKITIVAAALYPASLGANQVTRKLLCTGCSRTHLCSVSIAGRICLMLS